MNIGDSPDLRRASWEGGEGRGRERKRGEGNFGALVLAFSALSFRLSDPIFGSGSERKKKISRI